MVVDCKKHACKVLTKRGILKAMESLSDPLGAASLMLLVGKQPYSKICEENIKAIDIDIEKNWLLWLAPLPDPVIIPKSMTRPNQKIHEIKLHGPEDAIEEELCPET